MEQRIQIKYSPGWRRWNVSNASGMVQSAVCATDTPAGKQEALRRLLAYLKSSYPDKTFYQVSEDEWREGDKIPTQNADFVELL